MAETNKTISAKLFENVWLPFVSRHNFENAIKEDLRFAKGDQWPDDNVMNEVRITGNHIGDGIRKNASKIGNTPIYFGLTASNGTTDCTALNRYDSFVCTKMGHEAFKFQAIINALTVGTEITYLCYDPDAPVMSGSLFEGGLSEEHISPLNFAVANPYETDIQKQEWVMFWSDIYVKQLKAIIKDEKFTDSQYKEQLATLKDDAVRSSGKELDVTKDLDIINNTLVRTYFRFFRIDGEVCYTMETEHCEILKYPRPLSRIVEEEFAKKVKEEFDKKAKNGDKTKEPAEDERSFSLVEDLEIDFADTVANVNHKPLEEDGERKFREKFSLYPFAIYVPYANDHFLFGNSMTKNMIPMQKAINSSLSILVKAGMNIAFNKVYVRKGAMAKGDTFSSDPADNVQHDNYKGNGNGYYTLNPPSMPAELFKTVDTLVNEMKDVNNFTDFANGNMANQETSGFAVEQMLRQANSPLEQLQKLFWEYETKLCRLRIMFYKHFVDEQSYTYEYSPAEYDEEEKNRQAILSIYQNGGTLQYPDSEEAIPPMEIAKRYAQKTPKTIVRRFRGKDIWGADFDIKITAQQGLVESELATSEFFKNMFANGAIEAYKEHPELLQFIVQNAPKAVLPEEARASMLHFAESMTRGRIAQLEQTVAMLSQKLEEAAALGKSQAQQFREHMNMADTLYTNAQRDAQQMRTQMSAMQGAGKPSEGEVKSNNAKGIPNNGMSNASPLGGGAIN